MRPNVNIHSISNTKISDEQDYDKSVITFSFDVPVVEFTVNVLGTSYSSGKVAEKGSKTVDEMMKYSVDEMLSFTVDSSMSFSSGEELSAEVDWTELYQEGDNRVNIYGRSLNNEWTLYES